MLLELLGSERRGADAQFRGALQETVHDGYRCLVTDVIREPQWCLQDFAEEVQLVFGVPAEGQWPYDELVHHDTEGPPIHCARVALAKDGFGSEVLWCSDERVGPQSDLATAEVHELRIALEVEQNVLRLEVTVQDRTCVEVLQRECDRTAEKLRLRLGEVADLTNGEKKVAATKEFSEEVHVFGVLESLYELHDARMVALCVDVAFHANRLLLPLSDHLLLADALQGVAPVFVVLMVHQLDDAERASADDCS
mmetsp:Transcript_89316/g.251419  ORF Transcript_89316/g.251419 Transcript_89316/m.251419 type:complete len:253 (-) Transcript_89316:2014-2772(-)